MSRTAELMALERAGWAALATGGEAAGAFYAEVLAGEVLFLLPGGLVIDDRAAVIESMGGDPWSSYELADERVVGLGEGCAVVGYRARAVRGGHEYEALISSTYVEGDGGWKLAVHQQTPL